ncbi:MAG: hypothetical protein IKF78_10490 [Atopobiaceae bacterium]|nr:hypothetical protein [Atopobiaceae bacterium]
MPHIELPELNAMQTVADAMEGLSPQERKRVVAWIADYTLQDESVAPFTEDSNTKIDNADAKIEESSAECINAEVSADFSDSQTDVTEQEQQTAYDTFADFYEAAAPRKGAQKAAVAGYWLETTQGLESWKAFEVNKLLKQIGVKVSSMSIVLSNAVKTSNPLIVELERQSTGERSRKTFRLSDWGRSYVQNCIG